MIKGIYTSASAMIPRIKKQELTANNLANASTPGYKRDTLFTKELSRAEKKVVATKSDWEQPMVDEVYTNFAPGVFDRTGNQLDLAIDGDGFFRLQLPDGSTGLTRAGTFSVNSEGQIEFPGGALLVGEGGPIEVGSGGDIQIGQDGTVQVDGNIVGTIVPVSVPDVSQLEKVGSSVFAVPNGVDVQPVTKARIQQGFLEASNVDIVREMIDMIISFRNYEADSKSVQVQDQTLDNLFNRVAPRS
ncbi:MAG TPA: flagellar basal-body rod protein FlgF [candidate division Zixibacteria bacterium]|nr:flagellar basal-body rod protein FlgF [candidate division Zixibacteria bacterium]